MFRRQWHTGDKAFFTSTPKDMGGIACFRYVLRRGPLPLGLYDAAVHFYALKGDFSIFYDVKKFGKYFKLYIFF